MRVSRCLMGLLAANTLSLSSFVGLFVRPLLVFLESEVHLECHKASKSVKGTQ